GCLLALDHAAKRSKTYATPRWRHPPPERGRWVSEASPEGVSIKKQTPARPPSHNASAVDLPLSGGGKRSAPRARVLDLGSGSGVLAIAAAKALRVTVLASDIDARAVQTGRANARRNGTRGWIEFAQAAGVNASRLRRRAPFDLVFAN